MANIPVLKPREVVAILGRLGFSEVRQRGSHKQFRHADGRGTTVPIHSARDLSPIILRQIAKDLGLTIEELLELSWSISRVRITRKPHAMNCVDS